MASIRKRNGKYQVQVRRAGCKFITKSFYKRSDAQEWARAMEVKLDRNDLPVCRKSLSQNTVKDIVMRYRDEISVKKKSYNSEVFILNAFLRTKLADIPLSQISISDFASYRDKRLISVKAGTVNRELSIIKHAFDIALNEWGYPKFENPLAKLKKLKVNNARNRRITDEELALLREAAKKTRNPYIMPIVYFALETAMRRGEILSTRWSDVCIENRTLHIPITKNGYARTIPLTHHAIDILDDLPRCGEKCFPITANSLRMAWDRLIARAGIENLHLHDCRHEAISRFFERGLSIPEVALISGHRSYSMLQRYTHLRAEDLVSKI